MQNLENFCTVLMDINHISVSETLTCTLGDISPIVFHTPLVQKIYFLNKSWDLLRGKNYIFYCPEVNFGLIVGQPQSFDVNHLFCC